ncbi:MAG: hypothetical protein A3G87_07460 [Omnitrophica bacterium RIFCSPLOWO2_12_FULL_50_11]|nr:MAG: hypothetical protein A3G87_07460 [Omnitrophica bacterium RIFCSPLOWO2_12_FULL_50_11]
MSKAAKTTFVVEPEENWIDNQIGELKENGNRAEKKEEDRVNPKPEEQKLESPESEMKPSLLSQIGVPRLSLLFLVFALLGAGAFAFLFVRESSLRQGAVSQLAQTEQERLELSQAVSQLRIEVAEQREEISRLVADLKAAHVKAGLVDTIRSDHEAELARMKAHYEEQTESLRSILQIRDEVITTFESNLNAIRELLKSNTAAVEPRSAKAQAASGGRMSPARGIRPAGRPGVAVPTGRVLKVNPVQQFIVVNLGSNEGAQEGLYIQIYRGGTFLGEGRIDRVYQNLSAATIVSEDTLSSIQAGDKVFLVF